MPRYIIYDSPTLWWTAETLAEALQKKSEYGGIIYEPLGMTAAEKIAAEDDWNKRYPLQDGDS